VAVGTICAYPNTLRFLSGKRSLGGLPEETNAPYGLAKKMLLVQAQAYRAQYGFNAIYLLPVNLYGPGDNFFRSLFPCDSRLDKKNSGCHGRNRGGRSEDGEKGAPGRWKRVRLEGPAHNHLGTGKATREFLYVEDCAEGIVLAAEKYDKPDP